MSYCKQFVYLSVSILALMLAACSVQAEMISNSSDDGKSIQDAQTGQPPKPVMEAQRWLAEQLGVPLGQVKTVETEQVDWPDSCLGLGGPDESCAQVITPGWRAVFEVNGQEYEVRTDDTASIIRLASEGTTEHPEGGDVLAGTSWRLVSLGPNGSETPVIEGSEVTLEFGADGTVSGSGGCNSYGGDYQTEDSTITFSNIISTLVACIDEDITQQETVYLQALNSADEFYLEDGSLTIAYDNGQGHLNFEMASAAA